MTSPPTGAGVVTPAETPGGAAGAEPDAAATTPDPSPSVGPSAEAVRRAAELLEGVAIRTPVEESRWLSRIAGGPVLLKAENLQRAGSFKIRGAYVRMTGLTADERSRGVVAASAGNHAQGVALAAQLLGIRAVVYMPNGAPLPKEKATRGYGAEVRFSGSTIDDALVSARQYADETGAVLVHPFDHPDVVAGQATCGLELLEQCPSVRTVIVPTGGGGLLAGIARSEVGTSRRPGRRGAGRGRRVVPRVAREGLPAGADVHDYHGRRHRGGPAGRRAFRGGA